MSFLDSSPFDSNAAFEESKPTDAILREDGIAQAWEIGVCWGEWFRATPLSEATNNPEDNFRGCANGLKPIAELGQKESPNEENGRFLASPDVSGILAKAATWAIRGQLLFPVYKHGANSAMARSMVGDPSSSAHGKALPGIINPPDCLTKPVACGSFSTLVTLSTLLVSL